MIQDAWETNFKFSGFKNKDWLCLICGVKANTDYADPHQHLIREHLQRACSSCRFCSKGGECFHAKIRSALQGFEVEGFRPDPDFYCKYWERVVEKEKS